MDHSQMDHSMHTSMDMGNGGMDHGGMGHGGMGKGDMCSMNMIFTWSTDNLCVVFRWWHIRTHTDLLLTLVAVVLLGMGYEYLKVLGARLDAKSASRYPGGRVPLLDESPVNQSSSGAADVASPYTASPPADRLRLSRALLYCFQVFYSFFLMLVFMTYNGWLMLAVTFGAFLGYYTWGYRQPARRDMSCH